MKRENITIGGLPFKVVYSDLTKEGLCGDLSWETHTIRVNSKDSLEVQFDTLRHEILHAALWISGLHFLLKGVDEELEEAVVRAIENIAFPAFNQVDKKAAK